MNQKIRQIFLFILAILLLGAMPATLSAQNRNQDKQVARITVQGQVLDSITGEPLDFVNIAEKGTTNGTITNTQGNFSMLARPGSVIQFSYLGYDTKTIVTGNRKMNVTIQMLSQDVQLSEVVVKPKRERYRRKDNPAVILIRNVIEHKDDHSPKENDYFSETRYDNMTYSLNNFSGSHLARWKKKFKFIENFIDTAIVTGTPVLPVSTDERIEKHYWKNATVPSPKLSSMPVWTT